MSTYTFATHFLPRTSQKSAFIHILFWKISQPFILRSLNAKKWFSAKKDLSNLIQASIINKTCWFLAYLQHLEIQKSCGSRIFEFLIFFQDFAAFWLKKWPNLKKINFLKFRGPKFQKWKKKSKFRLLQVFCIIKIYK